MFFDFLLVTLLGLMVAHIVAALSWGASKTMKEAQTWTVAGIIIAILVIGVLIWADASADAERKQQCINYCQNKDLLYDGFKTINTNNVYCYCRIPVEALYYNRTFEGWVLNGTKT